MSVSGKPPVPVSSRPNGPPVEHKSWRTRKLYAEEGWDEKSSRVKRRAAAWPHMIVVGVALLIIGFWLVSSNSVQTFPFVYVILGIVHGIQAIVKTRRNRRAQNAGTEVAKVFD